MEVNVNVFWCPVKEILVNDDAKLQIEFLPFSVGQYQCSVLLINEDFGDMVYSVEAECHLPLPSCMPFQSSSHAVRVKTADISNVSHGNEFTCDLRTIYWRCSINEKISENIIIPLLNKAKEKALGIY